MRPILKVKNDFNVVGLILNLDGEIIVAAVVKTLPKMSRTASVGREKTGGLN